MNVGRCRDDFAAWRYRTSKPLAKYAAATARVALPALLTMRTVRQVWRAPHLRPRLWRALPSIAGFSCIQTAAEIQGILRG